MFRKKAIRLLLCLFTAFFAGICIVPAQTQMVSSSRPVSSKNPNTYFDTVTIRFDYKQSALFQSYTLDALDSITKILKSDKRIKLAIDGYAFRDEGSDTICYYLSLNRALFIQTYILGRGIDSARITSIKAYGKTRQQYVKTDADGRVINCRAELRIEYPVPPEKFVEPDRDSDGIADKEDKCPDEFGFKDNNGCPNNSVVIIPFPIEQANLYSQTYKVLDSVINVLSKNPNLTINIDGHAFISEGSTTVCNYLASERAEIVRQYLLSRYVNPAKIIEVKNYGISRPINPGSNPLEMVKNARAEITFLSK